MITVTDNKTHIMQMRDDFKITEVKKADIIDFKTITTNGCFRIAFTIKGKFNVNGAVIMRFLSVQQFNAAIKELIKITDRMGV